MATKTELRSTKTALASITPSKVTGAEKIASRSKARPAVEPVAKPNYLEMKAGERNAAILELSKDVINKLRKIGFQAVAYERGPIGPLVFTMGLDNNAEVYRFWVGNSSVEIIDAISTPKPQAVIRVREDAHKIVQKFRRKDFVGEYYLKQGESSVPQPSADTVINTVFPTGTVLKMQKLQFKRLEKPTPGGSNVEWTGEVHISVPKFDNHYLIGYDENKCFIAQLPKSANTVAEAIKVLTPAGLVKGHVRQGEWFFNPCSKAEIATVDKFVQKMKQPAKKPAWEVYNARGTWWHANGKTRTRADYTSGTIAYGQLEAQSSHRAQYQVIIDDTQYVKGDIIDSRQGRHGTITLENWHRVIRNNEVAQTQTAQGVRPARRWD